MGREALRRQQRQLVTILRLEILLRQSERAQLLVTMPLLEGLQRQAEILVSPLADPQTLLQVVAE
jgi:hypothetical protein